VVVWATDRVRGVDHVQPPGPSYERTPTTTLDIMPRLSLHAHCSERGGRSWKAHDGFTRRHRHLRLQSALPTRRPRGGPSKAMNAFTESRQLARGSRKRVSRDVHLRRLVCRVLCHLRRMRFSRGARLSPPGSCVPLLRARLKVSDARSPEMERVQ